MGQYTVVAFQQMVKTHFFPWGGKNPCVRLDQYMDRTGEKSTEIGDRNTLVSVEQFFDVLLQLHSQIY